MFSIHQDYIRAGNACRANLHLLAHSSLTMVRRRVAENPAAPAQLLAAMSRDESSEVRIAVGLNRNCEREILFHLANDMDPDVRFALAEASYLRISVLKHLTTDPNPFVASRASETISRKHN